MLRRGRSAGRSSASLGRQRTSMLWRMRTFSGDPSDDDALDGLENDSSSAVLTCGGEGRVGALGGISPPFSGAARASSMESDAWRVNALSDVSASMLRALRCTASIISAHASLSVRSRLRVLPPEWRESEPMAPCICCTDTMRGVIAGRGECNRGRGPLNVPVATGNGYGDMGVEFCACAAGVPAAGISGVTCARGASALRFASATDGSGVDMCGCLLYTSPSPRDS